MPEKATTVFRNVRTDFIRILLLDIVKIVEKVVKSVPMPIAVQNASIQN